MEKNWCETGLPRRGVEDINHPMRRSNPKADRNRGSSAPKLFLPSQTEQSNVGASNPTTVYLMDIFWHRFIFKNVLFVRKDGNKVKTRPGMASLKTQPWV